MRSWKDVVYLVDLMFPNIQLTEKWRATIKNRNVIEFKDWETPTNTLSEMLRTVAQHLNNQAYSRNFNYFCCNTLTKLLETAKLQLSAMDICLHERSWPILEILVCNQAQGVSASIIPRHKSECSELFQKV